MLRDGSTNWHSCVGQKIGTMFSGDPSVLLPSDSEPVNVAHVPSVCT